MFPLFQLVDIDKRSVNYVPALAAQVCPGLTKFHSASLDEIGEDD